MLTRRLAAALTALVSITHAGVADSLTFVAQWDPAIAATNYSWFNANNWWEPDATGNLVPASRVPTASETAIITGLADAGVSGVRVQTLILTNAATVANGNFAVERLEMLSASVFRDAHVNVLTFLSVGGTNCVLNGTTLNILSIGSGLLSPLAPAPASTLLLDRSSVLLVAGWLSLADGSEINALGASQNSLIISSGGVLACTNTTAVRGVASNHLVIDNSGLILVDSGTLTFQDGIDWRSSAGRGEFRAATPDAQLLCASPMQVPAYVTSLFTGPGTNRFQAGANVDGEAQVGLADTNSQFFLQGRLEVDDSVSGSGTIHILGNLPQTSILSWNNGTFSLPEIQVDSGAEMHIAGSSGAKRELSGCSVNNSGLCALLSPDLTLAQGASIQNEAGGIFEVHADGTFSGSPGPEGGEFNNRGIFRKLTPGATVFGTTDPAQGPDFNNLGLVDLQSGRLNLFGGTSSGEFRSAAEAVLWFWGGTHTLNAGSAFTGGGSVRVLQGAAVPKWQVTGGISAEELELGENGTIAGPGKTSTARIRIGQFMASDNGVLTNGNVEAQTMQVLGGVMIAESTLAISKSLALRATNCTLSASTLDIAAPATAQMSADPTGQDAVLKLVEGGELRVSGQLTLNNGSLISGGGLPQSKIMVLPTGTLSSTNSAIVRGAAAGHLAIDTSGLIRVDSGTLTFADGIDWQSSGGQAQFHTAVPTALTLFTTTFQLPAGVTCAFTGPGTNRLAAGGTVDGLAQVGIIIPGSQTTVPGNLELSDDVRGAGILRVLSSGAQTGGMVWNNGALSVAEVTIDPGARMLVAGDSSNTHELSGCVIDNFGLLIWPGQTVSAGAGAVLSIMPGGTLDIQQDATLVFNNIAPRMTIASSGTFLKSGGTGESTIAADFTSWNLFEVKTGTLNLQGALAQNSGNTIVHGGAALSAPAFEVRGGTVSGDGLINAAVVNRAKFAPGTLIGVLSLSQGKDFQQTASGTLLIELGGNTPGAQYDQLAIGGNAQLAGELNLQLVNGFIPQPGQAFCVLTCGSLSGAFSRIVASHPTGTVWVPRYGATNVTVALANELSVANAVVSSRNFNVSFTTTPGLVYVIQESDGLNPPAWRTLKTINGDGLTKTVTEPLEGPCRFYRVQMQ